MRVPRETQLQHLVVVQLYNHKAHRIGVADVRAPRETQLQHLQVVQLYNHKANGNPSVLNCTQTDTEDDHPILRREVEATVQSLKKGKSAAVDNIPAELVQAG